MNDDKYNVNVCDTVSEYLTKGMVLFITTLVLIFSVTSCVKKELPSMLLTDEDYKTTVDDFIQETVEKVTEKVVDKVADYVPDEILPLPDDIKEALKAQAQKALAEKAKTALSDTQIVEKAATLVKKFEKFSEVVYTCPGGKRSIGYGFDAGKLKTIARSQADAKLAKRLNQLNKYLDKKVRSELTDGQRIALISFVYNVGTTAFDKSTLLKRLNEGEFTKAANELDRWVYVTKPKSKTKVVLKGLEKRRAAEKKMFNTTEFK